MVATLWLLLVLSAIRGFRSLALPTVSPAGPHIRNLRMDAARRSLTWEWDGTPGVRFLCRKGGRDPVRADPQRLRCSFPALSLCHATDFEVFPEGREGMAVSVRFPPADSDRTASARYLSCRVQDVDRLSCSWGRGPRAGSDVHYRMFVRDARHGPAHDQECPAYEVDAHGARVGCALDGVTDLAATLVTVTVNGSSHAGPVPCTDLALDLAAAEILTPPTVTAECNGSEALVRWVMRSWFHHSFRFTVQLNRVYVSDLRVVNPTVFSVRVRAEAPGSGGASPWSDVRSLDCNQASTSTPTMMSLLLTGGGAVLTGLAALLLCWRKSPLRSCLLPPIPRTRIPSELTGETVPWAPPPEECMVTRVMDAGGD